MANPRDKSSSHPFTDEARGERLQKLIAAAGFASRRAAEELIEGGFVRVNGIQVTTLPAWVDPARDEVEVDGRPLRRPSKTVYVMFFKPKGVVTTMDDPEGRPTVAEVVKHPSGLRLYPVGRLDMDSSGLLLLTNDGELADRLTHPRYEMHKGYEVTVAGHVTDAELQRIEGGIFLSEKPSKELRSPPRGKLGGTRQQPGRDDDRPMARRAQTGVLEVRQRDRDRTLLYMELREGRNRQIRRMMLDVGHPVKKLRRVSMGPLRLRGLSPGEWRELTSTELAMLRREAFADAGAIARRRDRAEKQATTKRTIAKAVKAEALDTLPPTSAKGKPAAEPAPEAPKTSRAAVRQGRREAELKSKGKSKRDTGRLREIVSWGDKPGPRGGGSRGSDGPPRGRSRDDGPPRGRSFAGQRDGGPRSGGPRSGGPRSGGPRSGGPRSGGPGRRP